MLVFTYSLSPSLLFDLSCLIFLYISVCSLIDFFYFSLSSSNKSLFSCFRFLILQIVPADCFIAMFSVWIWCDCDDGFPFYNLDKISLSFLSVSSCFLRTLRLSYSLLVSYQLTLGLYFCLNQLTLCFNLFISFCYSSDVDSFLIYVSHILVIVSIISFQLLASVLILELCFLLITYIKLMPSFIIKSKFIKSIKYMESIDITKLTYEIKQFPFIFDPQQFQPLEEQFSTLGYLTVPTIGRYGGGGYELENPLFVFLLPCTINQGRAYYREQELNLPEEVVRKLTHIQELIRHNRPPKKFKQTKETKEEEEENHHAPQYNPETFQPRPYFTLRFIISTSTCKKPQQFMNYVCHNYIFKHQNFQNTKKHVALVPVCLIPANNPGIYEWTKDHKSIQWHQLRSEYMSFHLKKGGPAFSPNNLKMGIQGKPKMLNFYTVLLTQLQYCVNYHWHFVDENETTKITDILKSSTSIESLLNLYKAFKGEDDAVNELERIFWK